MDIRNLERWPEVRAYLDGGGVEACHSALIYTSGTGNSLHKVEALVVGGKGSVVDITRFVSPEERVPTASDDHVWIAVDVNSVADTAFRLDAEARAAADNQQEV